MSVAIVTGSQGLVGSEACRRFAGLGMQVVGLDNDMRREFFGAEASTDAERVRLERELGHRYRHERIDIRDAASVSRVFARYAGDIALVIHTAAQPSHDWAAGQPFVDFGVNAGGTLALLEATRQHAPAAVFIFTSTNKVYGDRPNGLPLVEHATRWEIAPDHPFAEGITEEMSIDRTQHSVFGASKVAADVLVQEYGRYFGLRSACFRAGCITGPRHRGARLHGFLAYLVKCAATGTPYTVYGHRGKQVRDNIHSADLVSAFEHVFQAPRVGEVYNIGGGRQSHCSMLEAIAICERLVGRRMDWTYAEEPRRGDHIWWISGLARFTSHYPGWRITRNVQDICEEIFREHVEPCAAATVS